MPGGRPTSYDPKYCQELIDFMAQGYSYEAFAGKIGVSSKTLYNWEKDHPEFLQAKSEAFDQSRLFWETAAIKGLWNDKDGPTLNNTAWVFNMKNRFGWRDKQEVEHQVQAINIDVEDDEL